ncbi:MAG: radical SAM protein [Richelia sp. RM2_1_2]|nr:radical SAM protein [Richelia sp. RM2_1_2]
MTQYDHRIRDTQDFLAGISPSMCLAKWTQLSLHLQIGHSHSCHHPAAHKIRLDEISEDPANLHNTSFKKLQQQAMLKGDRPDECSYCWKIEDSGGISDRIWKSAESWSFDFKESVACNTLRNPPYVEVSFDSTCNFKCAYCSPSISSSWMAEIEQFGAYPTSDKLNDIGIIKWKNKMPIPQREHNPYVEAFWKWWPDLVNDLRVFRITGGEPLLSKNVWRVLDYLEENKFPELEFAINSNLGVDQTLIDKLIQKLNKIRPNVKNIFLFTSVDTYGKPAEYIRYGLNYEQFMKNTNNIIEHTDAILVYMITVSNLSLIGSKNLFEDILEQKNKFSRRQVQIDTPYLRYPYFLAVDILPEQYKKYWQDVIDFMESHHDQVNGFADYEIDKSKRVLPIINSAPNTADTIKHKIDFVKFVDEYDRRRNTSFFTTFPKLLEFYYQCKELDV